MARLPLAVLLLGVLAACGPANSQTTAPTSAASQPHPVAGSEYVRLAGTKDLFEIQAGNLALQKSDREDIRALARMIVDDHTRATETLKEATGKTLGVATLPTRLDNAHQAKLQQLQAAQGAEFDRLYLEMQKHGHQEALALHRAYATGGDNAALKVAAREFASTVQKHLEEVERISGTTSAPPPRG
jgi:putative membrane protein